MIESATFFSPYTVKFRGKSSYLLYIFPRNIFSAKVVCLNFLPENVKRQNMKNYETGFIVPQYRSKIKENEFQWNLISFPSMKKIIIATVERSVGLEKKVPS